MPNIPIISVAEMASRDVHAAVDRACREWGFFQIVDHGIPTEVCTALLGEAGKFFSLDTPTKRAISRTASNPWGFYDQELTKNTPDWKEILDYGPEWENERPQWPAQVPGLRQAGEAYYQAAEALAFKLLALVASNLGMPAHHLAESFHPQHSSFGRINFYPTCPTPECPDGLALPTHGHLAINHHTDSGALTVLLQDQQAGLEVLRAGVWHLIEPVPGALVVNIGDIVQVWSNDQYIAAVHRVRANEDNERFSVPFFFNPSYAANYAPLPSMVAEGERPRYRPINWGEFRAHRAAGDYADVGVEAHISQYRNIAPAK